MEKHTLLDKNIYSLDVTEDSIDIDNILMEFDQNSKYYNYTHYINNRWENIYLNPEKIPSVLPLLSFALSNAITLFHHMLKPHQTLIIPHELLGYEKNEFWFNVANPGESTRMHNHIETAVASGVYYLHTPKDSPNIYFKYGKDNEIEIESKRGTMIFFPSELDHYVPKNKSTDKRISLAFNCYIFPISASLKH